MIHCVKSLGKVQNTGFQIKLILRMTPNELNLDLNPLLIN